MELEDRVKALLKAVGEAEKGKDSSTEKFDAVWDLESLLQKSSKDVIEKFRPELQKLVHTALAQAPLSGSLVRVLKNAVTRLLDFDPDYKSAVNAVGKFQATINGRGAISTKVAAIRCIGQVFRTKSMNLASIAKEMIAVIVKQLRAYEAPLRVASIECLIDIIEGSGSSGAWLHEDIRKGIRPAFTDKLPEVRVACCKCIAALSRATNGFTSLDNNMARKPYVVELFRDLAAPVRAEIARTVGEMLGVAVAHPTPPPASPSKKNKKTDSDWNVETVIVFLASNFNVKNTKPETRSCMAQALVWFLHTLNPATLEANLEFIISQILGLLFTPVTRPEELLQIRLMVSYIMRVGLGEHIGETGQQLMIKVLASLFQQKKVPLDSEHLIAVLLREMCFLLLGLGEGASGVREVLTHEALPPLLTHPSSEVRQYAAVCFRCLARAMPVHLAVTLNELIDIITAELASLLGAADKNARTHQVHGLALGASALISAIPSSAMGIPTTITVVSLQTAITLLKTPPTNASVTVAVAQAGWAIVGALMTLGPSFVSPRLATLLPLWKNGLKSDQPPKSERDWLIFAHTKGPALAALAVMIIHCGSRLSASQTKDIVALLAAVLNVVGTLVDTGFKPSTIVYLQLLKAHLLKAFSAIPVTAYTGQYVTLLKILAKVLVEATHAPPLRTVLLTDDAILGPWDDSPEARAEQLLSFPPSLSQDDSQVWSRTPQETLSPAMDIEESMVDAAAHLFGIVFVTQAEKNRQQLLEHFVNCIAASQTPVQRATLQSTTLNTMVRVMRQAVQTRSSFGKAKLRSTLVDFLKEFIPDPNAEMRRGAAEALGCLARVEGDQFAGDLVKSLAALSKKTKDASCRSGVAFCLGAIKRSMGGMRAAQFLPEITVVLCDVARDPSTMCHIWALHSLCLTMDVAGPAFSQFVGVTLGAIYALLLSEEFGTVDDYRCLGRVVNALVQSLGPELQPTSSTMKRCNAAAAELRVHPDPLVQLEFLNLQQSLFLFAPHTVSVPAVLPYLKEHLPSSNLRLRHAAVICLRQIVQVNFDEMQKSEMEQQLFMMLDGEQDAAISKDLQLLITTLLDLLASSAPKRWIDLCKRMVLTSSRQEELVPQSRGGDDEGSTLDEDLGGMLGASGKSDAEARAAGVFIPRWRTKLFAMECVRRVMSVILQQVEPGQPSPHFDLALARQLKGDFLIMYLSDLIQMAFTAATSPIESLRPVGVNALMDILTDFKGAADPDYEGHVLLELYSAQTASSLRPSFQPLADAPPYVTASACSVLVSYVTSGILRDTKGIVKVLNLLTSNVDSLADLRYPVFSERATTMVQLSILSALAELQVFTLEHKTDLGEKIASALAPVLVPLKFHWLSLLRDYAIISTQTKAGMQAATNQYGSFFAYITVDDVAQFYEKAWPVVLRACTSLVGTKLWDRPLEAKTATVDKASKLDADETAAPKPVLTIQTDFEDRVHVTEMKDEYFYLLLGIAMNVMSSSTAAHAPSTVACLKALTSLLSSAYLDPLYLSLDVCEELVQLVAELVLCTYNVPTTSSEDVEVQLEATKFVHHLVSSLSSEYFKEDGGKLLHHLLEIAVLPIHQAVPSIYPYAAPVSAPAATTQVFGHFGSSSGGSSLNASKDFSDGSANVALVKQAIATLPLFPSLLSPESRTTYVPVILYILIRILDVGRSNVQLQGFLAPVLEAVRAVVKNAVSRLQESERVLSSAAATVVRALDSGSTEAPLEPADSWLLSALLALEEELPLSTAASTASETHASIVKVLRRATASADWKVKLSALQGLRAFVTRSASGSAHAIGFQYLQELAPELVLLLFHVKDVKVSPEQLAVCSEVIRILVYTQTLIPAEQQPTFMAVLVPTLVGLLKPAESGDALHDLVVQVLLKLATASAAFKNQIPLLHPSEKATMEAAFRATMQSAQQVAKVETKVEVAAPLKVDFSKFV
eukprot:TRINITY_DN18779_c0_g1_i1.p1 TRINITY_DN18779_c0_g1~~TRINITY_DN18779_c0_g1_i1.p1  ORF type:complete len:1950 (-),score=546.78 TRINITY_DN18779_c0_g1_i1:75-5924(-)